MDDRTARPGLKHSSATGAATTARPAALTNDVAPSIPPGSTHRAHRLTAGRLASESRMSRHDAGASHPGQVSHPRVVPPIGSGIELKRDPRLDVMRGLALLMIFVDHIPRNLLSLVTMHNFGFCDAAELFVLIAGMSSMIAYGRLFQRRGAMGGLSRIARRLARIYAFQIGLLLITLAVVYLWTTHFGMPSLIVRPFFDDPFSGVLHGLALHAVPTYLDILPLYIALFAVFPLVYAGLRLSPSLTLAGSGALWVAANMLPVLNVPNWMNGGHWFFNPAAWQFLFTIGAALVVLADRYGGQLPRLSWLQWLCAAYLVFAFFQSVPWTEWQLPPLNPLSIPPPDKTTLAPLRLVNILAVAYLALSSDGFRVMAAWRVFRPIDLCGRHSLEVFATGCVAALFGRLAFRTFGAGPALQILVNAVGFAAMWSVAAYFEARKAAAASRRRPTAEFSGSHSAR
ncbi:MAG TPA: OpgC domain-containing protein [Xanthobacteraceae bacterium]|jgi:hypothetical protein|nr:OpgC domain-containing protein [Xanthobacteraceae bacterium]